MTLSFVEKYQLDQASKTAAREALVMQGWPLSIGAGAVTVSAPATKSVLSADEVNGALVRLSESIHPEMEYHSASAEQETRNNRAKRTRAALYNSHSLAAHRSSVVAYMSGNDADHEVAASHHDMAASHAENGQKAHAAKEKTHSDYAIAAKYHKSQAKAHRDAAENSRKGNRVSRYELSVPGASY